MELGKRLTEIRKQNNMTQENLAEIFHVTRQTISNWENAKSYPDIETLVNISDVFQISLDTLLKGDKDMVRKITKEQVQGKKQKQRLILAVLIVIILIITAAVILNNTVTTLDKKDYTVAVKEITLENVTIDEVNQIATYRNLEGGEYIKEDETKQNAGNYEEPDSGIYVFKGEEYANLITYGKAYEVIVTSDKRIDGWFLSSDENDSLKIDVWRSNSNILKKSKSSRVMSIWFEDFDRIYDNNDNLVWERE